MCNNLERNINEQLKYGGKKKGHETMVNEFKVSGT